MVHRVIVIVSCALALAACESNPDWMKANTGGFKTQSVMDTVRFESEPPGAEAKTSSGQSCRTPCALALPVSAATVTFTLNGYQPETERLETFSDAGSFTIAETNSGPQLRPNPVFVELTPAAPQKPGKKQAPKNKPAGKQAANPAAKQAAKPAARSKPATAAAPALAPISAEPMQQAPAPWPSAPPQR